MGCGCGGGKRGRVPSKHLRANTNYRKMIKRLENDKQVTKTNDKKTKDEE